MKPGRERTSKRPSVEYLKPVKPIISNAERKRQAESLRVYKPGGDDIA